MRNDLFYWKAPRRGFLIGGAAGTALGGLALVGCSSSSNNNGKKSAATASAPSGNIVNLTAVPSVRPAAAASTGVATPAAAASTSAATAARAGTAQTAAEGQPKFGGDMQMSLVGVQRDFDPHRSLFDVSAAGLMLAYNLAIEQNAKTFELEPALVNKWEVVGNGDAYNLTINPEAKWHNKPPVNGRAVDAQDIAYNLMRIAAKLPGDKPAERPRATTLEGMDKAEATDKQTVHITMSKPNSSYLVGMTTYTNDIVPREMPDQLPFDDPNKLVGSGGYTVEKWDGGVEATFTKNPNYWRKTAQGQRFPYLDHVKFTWLNDLTATMAAFIAGKIDYRDLQSQDDVNTVLKGMPNARIIKYGSGSRFFWRFNTQRKPFDDPRLWKAFHLALDYKAVNDGYYGAGNWDYCGLINASFPGALTVDEIKKLPGWDPDTKQQDIQTAKQMMAAAGYPDGKLNLTIYALPTNLLAPAADMAVRIQSQMQKIWPAMQVKIDTAPDGATFQRNQSSGNFDTIVYASSSLDTVPELIEAYATNGSRNYGKYSNPQVDDMLNKALVEFDTQKRNQMALDVQKFIIDSGNPTLWLESIIVVQGFNPRIHGYEALLGPAGTPGGEHEIRYNSDRVWIA